MEPDWMPVIEARKTHLKERGSSLGISRERFFGVALQQVIDPAQDFLAEHIRERLSPQSKPEAACHHVDGQSRGHCHYRLQESPHAGQTRYSETDLSQWELRIRKIPGGVE